MRYSDDYKEGAIELSNEIGVRQGAKAAGISPTTLTRWRATARKSGEGVRRINEKRRFFTEKEKADILFFAKENGYEVAARRYGISRQTIYTWTRGRICFEYVLIDWGAITSVCDKLGLSAAGLAAGCSVSRATLWRWKRRGIAPKHKLQNICQALGISERAIIVTA